MAKKRYELAPSVQHTVQDGSESAAEDLPLNAVELGVQGKLLRIEAGQVYETDDVHEINALDAHELVAEAQKKPAATVAKAGS